MFWGVAAMVVKDAVKQPYLKGRDYERNVRQVYRDVDNLKITTDHVRTNCTPEDLTTGPHAAFIRRAEVQLKDAYRTLDREYPRKAGFSRLMEYASTPGAEMTLLDIGKEANQTAKGLGDLLSEIRFARMGKSKEEGNKAKGEGKKSRSSSPLAAGSKEMAAARGSSPRGIPILHPSHPAAYDMSPYEYGGIASDGFGSPHSLSSGDQDSLFDRPGLRPSSVYSPPSSIPSDSSRGSSSSRSRHKHHNHDSKRSSHKSSSAHHSKQQNLLQPSSWPRHQQPLPFDEFLKANSLSRERELALDNLQHTIDNALRAQTSADNSGSDGPSQEEEEAMEYLEYALHEVLRLQRMPSSSSSRRHHSSNSSVDQDLCDAVEDLDEAMKGLVAARSEKDKKHALKRVSRALEKLDKALAERKRYQARAARRESRSRSSQREVVVPPTSRRKQQGRSSADEHRRFSMHQ